MTRLGAFILLLGFTSFGGTSQRFAQASQSAAGTSFNVRQGAVAELKEAQSELVSLARAMPADKYTWRPAKGVRSVAEVYLHVCAGNFGLTALAGVPAKAGFKFQGFEKSTTDKAQIVNLLNDCFAFAENGISSLSEADLSKPVKWDEYPTVGDLILHIVAHAHEHLGQSIAYARMNGVVPPWTAAADQRRAQRQQGSQTQAPRPPQN
jgi:uncharacterized damage-inducible protein DinB